MLIIYDSVIVLDCSEEIAGMRIIISLQEISKISKINSISLWQDEAFLGRENSL